MRAVSRGRADEIDFSKEIRFVLFSVPESATAGLCVHRTKTSSSTRRRAVVINFISFSPNGRQKGSRRKSAGISRARELCMPKRANATTHVGLPPLRCACNLSGRVAVAADRRIVSGGGGGGGGSSAPPASERAGRCDVCGSERDGHRRRRWRWRAVARTRTRTPTHTSASRQSRARALTGHRHAHGHA